VKCLSLNFVMTYPVHWSRYQVSLALTFTLELMMSNQDKVLAGKKEWDRIFSLQKLGQLTLPGALKPGTAFRAAGPVHNLRPS